MAEIEQNTSLIDLKAIAEPAGKLIDAVSKAVGVWYEPINIKRLAKADVEATRIKEIGKLELEETLTQRAIDRITYQETRRQKNIENITNEAIKFLPESVSEEKVDEDWMFQFIENCQDISDEQMKSLWAKILAGEVTQPKTFSLRTLGFLKTMSKVDAEIFSIFCNFLWRIGNRLEVVLFTLKINDYFAQKNLPPMALAHLQSIGLIVQNVSFMLSHGGAKISTNLPNAMPVKSEVILSYDQVRYRFYVPEKPGVVGGMSNIFAHSLTATGIELAKLCNYSPDDEYKKIFLNDLTTDTSIRYRFEKNIGE